MIYVVIAAYLIIAFVGCRPLFQKKWWPEFAVYLTLLTIGFSLLSMQALGIRVPSLGQGIQILIMDVLHMGYH